jgi:hypothetical protein
MKKGTVAGVVVFTLLAIIIGILVFDGYAQVRHLPYEPPKWIIAICVSCLSAVVYSEFKRKS